MKVYNTMIERLEKHHYIDVARKFKGKDPLHFFVASALEKWTGYRDGTEIMAAIGLIPVNYPMLAQQFLSDALDDAF